jgi:hypothetical protein
LKTRLCLCLVALAAMTGCATKTAPAVDFDKKYLEAKARYEPNIGKNYWPRANAFLCPKPTTNIAECVSILAGSKLHLDGIERGVTGDAYYHVTLEDGRSGYIDAFILVTFATDIDPAQIAAECKRCGEPRVGMTAKQVEATCWGKPGHVDRLKTARGTTDRYVYDQGRVVLKNGIVTAVKIRGTLQ